jgi:hypothetical protein
VAVEKMDTEYLEYMRRLIGNKRSLTPDSARVMLDHTIDLCNKLMSLKKPMTTKTSRIIIDTIDELDRVITKYQFKED